MSTGNFRGQRTQSSANGYKTLASSIASGNNSGCFKRIYINAYQRLGGNSDLALSSTLGITKNYYRPTSNSVYGQQPTLAGLQFNITSNPNARTLTQVLQQSIINQNCSSDGKTWKCSGNCFCSKTPNVCGCITLSKNQML